MNGRRSPLTFTKLEISLAFITPVVAFFGLYNVVVNSCCAWGSYNQEQPIWFKKGLEDVFWSLDVPGILVMSFSSISLLRAIRNDVSGLSRAAHLAFAWPLLSLPFANIFSFIDFCSAPVSLILGLAAAYNAKVRGSYADFLAFLFSIAWIIFVINVSSRLAVLFWD